MLLFIDKAKTKTIIMIKTKHAYKIQTLEKYNKKKFKLNYSWNKAPKFNITYILEHLLLSKHPPQDYL